MQRERQFAQYQDDGVFYEKRPTCGSSRNPAGTRGAVMLVEIPTPDETKDNIVAFWTPEDKPQPGPRISLRLSALLVSRESARAGARGRAWRRAPGSAASVGQKRTHFAWRFVVDFARWRPRRARRVRARGAGDQRLARAHRAVLGTAPRAPARTSGGRSSISRSPTTAVEPVNLRSIPVTRRTGALGDLALPVHAAAARAAQALKAQRGRAGRATAPLSAV